VPFWRRTTGTLDGDRSRTAAPANVTQFRCCYGSVSLIVADVSLHAHVENIAGDNVTCPHDHSLRPPPTFHLVRPRRDGEPVVRTRRYRLRCDKGRPRVELDLHMTGSKLSWSRACAGLGSPGDDTRSWRVRSASSKAERQPHHGRHTKLAHGLHIHMKRSRQRFAYGGGENSFCIRWFATKPREKTKNDRTDASPNCQGRTRTQSVTFLGRLPVRRPTTAGPDGVAVLGRPWPLARSSEASAAGPSRAASPVC
jgi:hypothetical protein